MFGVILHPLCPKRKRNVLFGLLTQKNMQSCVDYARQRVIDLWLVKLNLTSCNCPNSWHVNPKHTRTCITCQVGDAFDSELLDTLKIKTVIGLIILFVQVLKRVVIVPWRVKILKRVVRSLTVIGTWKPLKQPLFRVFEMIMNNPQDIFKRSHIRRLKVNISVSKQDEFYWCGCGFNQDRAL